MSLLDAPDSADEAMSRAADLAGACLMPELLSDFYQGIDTALAGMTK